MIASSDRGDWQARNRAIDRGTEARSIGYAPGNLGKSLLWSSADLTSLFIIITLMAVAAYLAGTWMLIALGGDIIVDLFAGKANAQAGQRGITYRLVLLIVAPLCALSFAGLFALSSRFGRLTLPFKC